MKPELQRNSPLTFLGELEVVMIWVAVPLVTIVGIVAFPPENKVILVLIPTAVLIAIVYYACKRYKKYKRNRRPEVLKRRRRVDWAIAWGILGTMSFPLLYLHAVGPDSWVVVSLLSYAIAFGLMAVTTSRNKQEKVLIREMVAAEAENDYQAQARAEAANRQRVARRKVEEEQWRLAAEALEQAEAAERAAAAQREREARRARMTIHPTGILDRVRTWDPDDVEHLVATLLRTTTNFEAVQKTPKGTDGGIDIHAVLTDNTGARVQIGIQVKRQKQSIGRPAIQLLRGSLPPGGRGMFVTTGTFNKNARAEALLPDKPGGTIELLDGREFAQRLVAAGFQIGRESGEYDSDSEL